MSKIICDVCGTSYPDTAIQCPICGCVRPGDVHLFIDNEVTSDLKPAQMENHQYTPVKGGRFSKSNVRKRNENKSVSVSPVVVNKQNSTEKIIESSSYEPAQKAQKPAHNKYVAPPSPKKERPEPTEIKSTKVDRSEKDKTAERKMDAGYTIAIIIFILAVALIITFLVIKFLPSNNNEDEYVDETTTGYHFTTSKKDPTSGQPTDPSEPEPTDPPTQPTNPPTEPPTEPTDPPAPPPPSGPDYYIYRVEAGVYGLWDVANRELGDGSRWPEIADLNDMEDPYIIWEGMELKIPKI